MGQEVVHPGLPLQDHGAIHEHLLQPRHRLDLQPQLQLHQRLRDHRLGEVHDPHPLVVEEALVALPVPGPLR